MQAVKNSFITYMLCTGWFILNGILDKKYFRNLLKVSFKPNKTVFQKMGNFKNGPICRKFGIFAIRMY